MRIHFNIDYHTIFGEQVVLHVLADGQEEALPMTTHDGNRWEYEWVVRQDVASLPYYYTVLQDGVCIRSEWTMVKHQLELSAAEADDYTTYDKWWDIPEDSYLYSSAFTDCVNHQQPVAAAPTHYRKTARLVVRVPQLREGQSLGILGSDAQLGAWNVIHVVPMTQHNYNEWMVDLDVDSLQNPHIEFKFVITQSHHSEVLMWETDNRNRCIDVPALRDGEVVVYELGQAFFELCNRKLAGTLVPVFSLRSKTSAGVGDFGDLKKMIDFVALTGQRVLQLLPINDTTIDHKWTDSYPYSCISIFALHPQYVDLNALPPLADAKARAAAEATRVELNALHQIDYERVNDFKLAYLHQLYEQEGRHVLRSKKFAAFFRQTESWLVPYAQYSCLRETYHTVDFSRWPGHQCWHEADRKALSNPRCKAYREVAFYYFVQYILDAQMTDAHQYAKQRGVILKGDIPIGVNRCGCDVWMEPKYFNLDEQTGAPPDDFSVNGQNWGFPTYNWDEMLKDGCQWWVRRFQNMSKFFDAYRIDHVLGFFRIWAIPIASGNGLMGQFVPSLGMTRAEIEAYGLSFDKVRDVLFLRDHRQPQLYHPRISPQHEEAYGQLDAATQKTFWRLHDDYFYRRNNQFWYHEAMKKLPLLVQATRMLVCAEDLGMVPECVPWVMNQLKILSLELQSMPKEFGVRFGHLSRNPYRSVCTISSHDMPTLRQWWDEDPQRTQDYYATMLHRGGEAPHPLPGWLASDIISRHLTSPSMLCILSIQDWLAIDEHLRLPDVNGERINIPVNPHHYWRYRMHLNIEDLAANTSYIGKVRELILQAGRV